MKIKEKMMKASWKKAMFRWLMPALVMMAAGAWSGCYIPGLGALGEAGDPPGATDPSGVSDTFYGKFNVYLVGNGDISSLNEYTNPNGDSSFKFYYILGDTFYPNPQISNVSANPEIKLEYNVMHKGDGTYQDNTPDGINYQTIYGYTVEDQTIYYKDRKLDAEQHPAAQRPEGVNANGELSLYYTHHWYRGGFFGGEAPICGADDSSGAVPPLSVADSQTVEPTDYYQGMFNDNPAGDGVGDRDVFSIQIDRPGTLVVFRIEYGVMRGKKDESNAKVWDTYHEPVLSLYDNTGTLLQFPSGQPAISHTGVDFWRYRDPELAYSFQQAGLYHLLVEDRSDVQCSAMAVVQDSQYALLVESPDLWYTQLIRGTGRVAVNADNRIRKGEIQPARSGSQEFFMRGGNSFEPDDLRTKVEDNWPDCDGVPGTGDEGDAGMYEQCGAPANTGAGDGKLQYYEVDNKAAIDDGEYFVGKPTNVGTALDSEVSITGYGSGLVMFVNYGSRIYMLPSLDGKKGLEWDLTNVMLDRPSVVPRQQRGNGSPTSPVVSSGPLGFCETAPNADDVWSTPLLTAWAQNKGTTATADGQVLNVPVGYPNVSAVTFGGNHHLDSAALVDSLSVWNGQTVITSGPDGIINTFFAPRLSVVPRRPERFSGIATVPVVQPPPGSALFGPGNPPNTSVYDANLLIMGFPVGGYITPLDGLTGGSNESGYLLGDDQWNPAIFDANTTNPGAYWQNQKCWFFNLGESFDQCAMGVPIDLRTGQEPVSIYGGANLDTVDKVLKEFRDGDYLCPTGNPENPDEVAICPGPNNRGKFGWDDMYIPIKGDDVLAVVYDPPHCFQEVSRTDPLGHLSGAVTIPATINDCNAGLGEHPVPPYKCPLGIDSSNANWTTYTNTMNPPPPFPVGDPDPCFGGTYEVGIDPGPDGILQTTMIDSYTVVDLEKWKLIVGGDHFCETADHSSLAICPGVELEIDLYSFFSPFNMYIFSAARQSQRLMSDWTMYMTTTETAELNDQYGNFKKATQMKRDFYSLYDDYFCIVNGKPAVCPGPNGYFQSYPLTEKVVAAKNDDLLNLYRDVSQLVGQPCYQLVGERYQNTPSQDEATRYVLYHYYGVRHDDRIGYDPNVGGFYVSTGANGINQSCVAYNDTQAIGYNKGLPNQPIIVPGTDTVLTTYPLADEVINWTDNVKKITTGPDGVSNSYAIGDDNLEIFLGTGQPDKPCVLAGPNGIADTTAQDYRKNPALALNVNDSQLYKPDEVTGFDAYNVFGPEIIFRGNIAYLYYSGLGWETLPEQVRDGSGALGDKGECKRSGLDLEWGQRQRNLLIRNASQNKEALKEYDFVLDEFYFRQVLDNNQGVLLAPRIGVATSTLDRILRDPTDWDFRNQPALDVGRVCGGYLDFPIPLPLEFDLPGLAADTNWAGAYSPDMVLAQAPDGNSPLFLMFFSGLNESEPNKKDSAVTKNTSSIGLARSLDGINFELVRELNPILATHPDFFESIFYPFAFQYAYPTVVNAGKDTYGEPMYGMFFNQFVPDYGEGKTFNDKSFERRTYDHIGYAVRKGKISLSSCNLNSNALAVADGPDRMRTAVQFGFLLVPLALVLAVRVFRRRET